VIPSLAMSADDSLPTDLASAHTLILAQRQAVSAAEARATAAESEAQYRALLIEKLKYTIKKLRHERFGQSAERAALLEQLELELADLEVVGCAVHQGSRGSRTRSNRMGCVCWGMTRAAPAIKSTKQTPAAPLASKAGVAPFWCNSPG